MDRHVELWLPLQLAPAIRQYRASHFWVVGRLKDGVAPVQAEAELEALIASWAAALVRAARVAPGQHVVRTEPLQDEIVARPGARSGCCRPLSDSCC